MPDLRSPESSLSATADFYRHDASRRLDPQTRSSLGQFMTPTAVAAFMASLFREPSGDIYLLDPGAGVGSLTAAFVDHMMAQKWRPEKIDAHALELDLVMGEYLARTLELCRRRCEQRDIRFTPTQSQEDFIEYGTDLLRDSGGLFSRDYRQYTHCIMNPPYKKIKSSSNYRKRLRQIGIETSNLYSAFLAIAIKLLALNGELVAIVPRSFCNGAYFKPFREFLLSETALRQLHVFAFRDRAFKDDDVLQENIILHAVKGGKQEEVVITSSSDARFEDMTKRVISFDKVVKPGDPDQFIHIAITGLDQLIVDRMSVFDSTLQDLDLDVSTGPVVDFRLRADIRQEPENGTSALIYPSHFTDGYIDWPNREGKKPNAICDSERSRRWLMPNGWYVTTRRFSAKEERRRIVAAIHDPNRIPGQKVGFENHLNVYHRRKKGLEPSIAKGLALFLNSTLVDLYFRQFSGHTQVNATDLRLLHYPSLDVIRRLGEQVHDTFPDQCDVDGLLTKEIEDMTDEDVPDPLLIQQKIDEAIGILESLGLPAKQQNERSALTLLALLDIRPDKRWQDAGNPLMGITPIIDFANQYYGRAYAPNTRESFRKDSMHQFVAAALALPNPDEPTRAVNSPNWVYQIEPNALELVRTFDTPAWQSRLADYLLKRETLVQKYARERDMHKISLVLSSGEALNLSPGAHSELIKDIVGEFGPRFVPGAELLYVGDTGSKMGYFDADTFRELNLAFDSHGKFPDVVLYFREKNWLLLIEAVTSRGPVDAKRYSELTTLFAEAQADLVYVTAFPDRSVMGKYLADISWETEVWVADSPTHLIHFDGQKFLGPYSY